MAQSNAGLVFRYFFVDFIGGIVLFPIWWYTRGLKIVGLWALGSVKSASDWLGLSVWVKNLFVPMYGESSWQGRIISFFIRLFMIFFRGIGVLLWAVIAFAALIVYVWILPFAVLGIIYHGGGLLIG